MPKVKKHKARTDIYNRGIRIPDENTKSGFRKDRSQPADEKDTLFVSKGETYYAWGVMIGGRGVQKYSKTPPTRSQLTQSEFLSAIYALEDNTGFELCESPEDLQARRDELAQEIRDLGEEQQSKYDNMPDGLQQGDTGQLLEDRAQSCESIADELDQVDLDYSEPDDDEIKDKLAEDGVMDDAEDIEAQMEAKRQELIQEWLEEKRAELEDVSWDYE